jgi:chemotaxis methyl-accepting protein methylase
MKRKPKNPVRVPLPDEERRIHGILLSQFDKTFLEKTVTSRVAATSAATWQAYFDRLAHDPAEAEALRQALNISFSVFFRNPIAFAILEQQVLPALVANQERSNPAEIRIWSAGCAAGQEAFSVAMLFEELAAARQQPIAYRIFATDLSADALALAQAGVYSMAAMQNVRMGQLGCFSIRGDTCTIAPRIRERVEFSVYDLLDERSECPPSSLYGDFDLICCCNLLFYYKAEVRQRILRKIHRALAPGGYFMTGEAETSIVLSETGFSPIGFSQPVFEKVAR